MRRIVCAAMRKDDSIILGTRHFDTLMRKQIKDFVYWRGAEQGFVDNSGIFCTRTEAWDIAVAANQIYRCCSGDGKELYSENLY